MRWHIRLLCVIPWMFAALALVWLAAQRYPLSGTFVAETVLDGKSPWINPFLPSERTTKPGEQADHWMGQRITADPVYFTIRQPGPYETVDVELEFRPLRQPLLEFGIVRDALGKDLDLHPMYSMQLSSPDMHPTHYDGHRGFVRSGIPASRLANAATEGLAIWDASSTPLLAMDQASSTQRVDVSLRGSHDFYLIPANGELHVAFTLQAANRSTGKDVAAFRVFRGDAELSQDAVGLSGSRETRMGQSIVHHVDLPKAEAAVYRIAFVAPDDVFIRRIETTSQHWVLGPRLVFGDVVGYATSTWPGQAWTTSRHIVAETFHKEGLQDVSFGPVRGTLVKTHASLRLDRTDDVRTPVELRAANGDVRFVGDGFFALRPDAFFEPRPRRFTDGTDITREHLDAVLTSYVPPASLPDGWFRSKMTYRVDPTMDTLRFVLSAPGLAARAGAVDVRRIRLTYHRPAQHLKDWFLTWRQELANAWHRFRL